jgi:hypothetical protein
MDNVLPRYHNSTSAPLSKNLRMMKLLESFNNINFFICFAAFVEGHLIQWTFRKINFQVVLSHNAILVNVPVTEA